MDKSWMTLNRASLAYSEGVDRFLEYAFSNTVNARIPCPCKKCANFDYQTRVVVRTHLIVKGMLANYVQWTHHGEKFIPRDQVNQLEAPTFEGESYQDKRYKLIQETGNSEIDEVEFYRQTHTRKDGTWLDTNVKETMEDRRMTLEAEGRSGCSGVAMTDVLEPGTKGRGRLQGRAEPKGRDKVLASELRAYEEMVRKSERRNEERAREQEERWREFQRRDEEKNREIERMKEQLNSLLQSLHNPPQGPPP